MTSNFRVELFEQLFSNTLLKHKKGKFDLIEANKNLWTVAEQVQLIRMVSHFDDLLKSKIVICFLDEKLKEVAISLKKKIFKRYESNIVISNFEGVFKEDIKCAKLMVCLGKTDRKLHEKCIQKKILFVSLISPESGQSYTHQLPVNVDSINKTLWLMLFIKKIYLFHSQELKKD